MVDEQIGLEGGGEFFQQSVGHRRAGEAELAHGSHIGLGEKLIVNEVVIERRHQIKVGDPLGRDEGERVPHLEARQADEGAADQRHGEERAHAHGVIERHDAERAFAVAVLILRDMRDRGRPLGALPARHALRLRGRARGIEHDRPGVGAGARERRRGIALDHGSE